ncbi:MAG TPA: hypothetical protein VL175_02375 [Pirellulales bacterium]|jgi:hypothetical protein|nr:hypothetical protein [Pirellulales bacterium]
MIRLAVIIILVFCNQAAAQVFDSNSSRPSREQLRWLLSVANDAIFNVISPRVDAQYSKGKPDEARYCIVACDRYEKAAKRLRDEILSEGTYSESTLAEFKEAGIRYQFACRDFYAATPSRPYQLPGWKIGGQSK